MRRSLLALAALLLPTVLSAGEGGVALSPALILVTDLVSSQEFSLKAATGATYDVVNNGTVAITTEVAVTSAPAYAPRGWEPGYEPLPEAIAGLVLGDARNTHHALTLAAGGKASLDLRLLLPDRPELRNRHFVAFVDVGQASSAALGASLRLRARVLIETAPSEGRPGAIIGWAPSRIDLTGAAGGWRGAAVLGNNGEQPATIDLLPLAVIYSVEESEKRSRYFSGGVIGNLAEPWMKPDQTSVTLAAGATVNVGFSGAPPASTADNAQEVWFAARRAAPDAPATATRTLAGIAYDRFDLVRLRFAKR